MLFIRNYEVFKIYKTLISDKIYEIFGFIAQFLKTQILIFEIEYI